MLSLERRFYVGTHSYEPTGDNFCHSSYLSGEDVLCAGTLGIKQGRVFFIDNRSGHYKPADETLVAALETLRMNGVDLSKIDVDYDVCAIKGHKDEGKCRKSMKGHMFLRSPPQGNLPVPLDVVVPAPTPSPGSPSGADPPTPPAGR